MKGGAGGDYAYIRKSEQGADAVRHVELHEYLECSKSRLHRKDATLPVVSSSDIRADAK